MEAARARIWATVRARQMLKVFRHAVAEGPRSPLMVGDRLHAHDVGLLCGLYRGKCAFKKGRQWNTPHSIALFL